MSASAEFVRITSGTVPKHELLWAVGPEQSIRDY